jgi:hypothetical protein
MTTFTLDISYSQVAVFEAGLADPFNDWTERHVAQGFSWRPGSVSFKTLDEAGTMTTTVDTATHFDEARSSAIRILRVPFSVPEEGKVEVGSLTSSTVIEVPPGQYELTFEHGRDSMDAMWCRLYFRSVGHESDAAIVRADVGISPAGALLMSAEAARS